MKKFSLIIALLFVTTYCFAQARNSEYQYEGKSSFSNIGADGLDVTGNASYLQLRAAHPVDGSVYEYYLWIDVSNNGQGVVYVASGPTMRTFSSFPTADWRSGMEAAGVGTVQPSQKVGAQ